MFRRLLLRPLYSNRHRQNTGPRSSSTSNNNNELNEYHEASDDTLEDLSEKLETVLEERYDKGADVSLSSGVLTVIVDSDTTFVINKQTPNRQLWLSSPLSGPMRFDYMGGRWIDKHSKMELRELLSKELSQMLENQVKL